MNKYYNDKGEVAVLYSPGFGAGWYSWHGVKELLYDPVVVKMVLDKEPSYKISNYCEDKYGDHYYGGADQLKIAWLVKDTRFYIKEYDGSETIILFEDVDFLEA